MDFAYSDAQEQLRTHVRAVISAAGGIARARSQDGAGSPWDGDLWAQFRQHGWTSFVSPLGAASRHERQVGGYVELGAVVEEVGRALAPVPMVASSLAAQAILIGGSEEQRSRWLPGLSSGNLVGTLASLAPDVFDSECDLPSATGEDKLNGVTSPLLYGAGADIAIVPARLSSEGALGLYVVDLRNQDVCIDALATLDVTRSYARATFAATEAELLPASAEPQTLRRIIDAAVVISSFEQLGAAEACLRMACDYAGRRVAFGQPIGAFQSLRHRLADMYCAIELARSNCFYGISTLERSSESLRLAGAVARISASQALAQAATDNLHIHGGVGYTWEADAHLFLRRCKSLELYFGGSIIWRETLLSRLASVSDEGVSQATSELLRSEGEDEFLRREGEERSGGFLG